MIRSHAFAVTRMNVRDHEVGMLRTSPSATSGTRLCTSRAVQMDPHAHDCISSSAHLDHITTTADPVLCNMEGCLVTLTDAAKHNYQSYLNATTVRGPSAFSGCG